MSTTAAARTTRQAPAASRFVLAGQLAAPLFLAVWLLQALLRPGYDLTRHPMSLLALGDGGVIQVANFVVTGLLVLALAEGFRLVLPGGHGRRAIPVLVAAMGFGLVASGVFRTDPGAGFPAGAPEGMPVLTPTGVLHEVAFVVVMVSYTVLSVVLVLRSGQQHDRALRWATVGTFLLVVVLSALPHAASFPVRTAVAGALPIAFLAAVALRELRR